MQIDLSEFETRLVLRRLRESGFDALVALQLRCFPSMSPWTKHQFDSHLRFFPEGQFGIELEGKLIASCSALIVDYNDYSEWHDWRVMSDDGNISNHDPEGDCLYGIEIQVDPEFRGMRLARRLYDARKELCREHGLGRIVLGGRMPGYGKVAHERPRAST